jgi:hypothetical protein
MFIMARPLIFITNVTALEAAAEVPTQLPPV